MASISACLRFPLSPFFIPNIKNHTHPLQPRQTITQGQLVHHYNPTHPTTTAATTTNHPQTAKMSSPTDPTSPKPTFFLNLPTTSLPAATTFYTALNFTHIPTWSDPSTSAFLLPAPNQSVALMLHDHARFQTFTRPGSAIADARAATEALFSVMCRSREAVEGWVDAVERAGGRKDPYVMEGFGEAMGMYVRSWEDLDGHVWEACFMLGREGVDLREGGLSGKKVD
jgi:predicted lactoylglutathione lyase